PSPGKEAGCRIWHAFLPIGHVRPIPGPPFLTDGRPFFCRRTAPRSRAVLYLFVKAAISGVIVAAVSEIARRYPGWGGLVASLPLTSLLAMVWLYRDTHDSGRVAELSISTFWF